MIGTIRAAPWTQAEQGRGECRPVLRGADSLPFQPGKHKRVAVKVIDMRGNEVIRVLPLAGESG